MSDKRKRTIKKRNSCESKRTRASNYQPQSRPELWYPRYHPVFPELDFEKDAQRADELANIIFYAANATWHATSQTFRMLTGDAETTCNDPRILVTIVCALIKDSSRKSITSVGDRLIQFVQDLLDYGRESGYESCEEPNKGRELNRADATVGRDYVEAQHEPNQQAEVEDVTPTNEAG